MTEFEDHRPATVRYAPSLNCPLHIGHVRTALYNWLFAQQNHGEFILRLDDTEIDQPGTGFADSIQADLRWLGIVPDMIELQSKRLSAYRAAAEQLKSAGLLYACFETDEELEREREILLSQGRPAVYGRAALQLSKRQQEALVAEGHAPYWRFLLPNYAEDPLVTRHTEIHWQDLLRGSQTVDLATLSDPVLVLAEGTFRHTLTSVIDDVEMSVSHVFRGDDRLEHTGVQLALFRALGGQAPSFGHHNLLTSSNGQGEAGRSDPPPVGSLREEGVEPMAVNSFSVMSGTSDNDAAMSSMDELLEHFNADSVSGPDNDFERAGLIACNRSLVGELPYEEVSGRLSDIGVERDKAEAFWIAVRNQIDVVNDARRWWDIIQDKPEAHELPGGDDLDYVRQALALLPPEPWDDETWAAWTRSIAAATGRNGRDLELPLRITLTGLSSGPELSNLLPLIGRAEILARLP